MHPSRSLLRRSASVLTLLAALGALVAVADQGASAGAVTTEGASAGDATSAPVAPEVEFKAANGRVDVIALTDEPGAQVVDDVAASLPEGSAGDIQAGRADHVSLTVDADGLDALAASPHVERVVENRANKITGDQWLTTIGAPAAQQAGWDGAGRTIAVLDTGVQVDHPYLAGKVVAEACFSGSGSNASSLCPGGVAHVVEQPGAATPCSGLAGCEHGTHVAGIAVGGPVSSPAALNGVAPAARLIAVKVFSAVTDPGICGFPSTCLVAFDSDVADALDWLDELRRAGNPLVSTLDAVNLSLGGGSFAGSCDSATILTSKIVPLRNDGVATVVATGNSGLNGSSGAARMSSPACVTSAVSVGSTTVAGAVSSFSNLTARTTILAPGSAVRSSVPGSGYGQLSGTSMSAPEVSAAFTEVRQRFPSISVATATVLLTSTGDRIATSVGVLPELQIDNALADIPGRPTFAPGAPFGSVDTVAGSVGSLRAAGWAIDPDTALPIPVHVYVDGVGTALVADGSRPDVHAAFGYGPRHGFTFSVAASPGPHQVCLYGINTGAGANVLLGCRTATVANGPPIGNLDVASAGLGSISVAGWAIDPDVAGSIPVHVYVDGTGYAIDASNPRSDLAAVYPAYGGNHGFAATVPASAGRHTVCVYGINTGLGSNSTIGCRSVVVPGGPPFGYLDLARRNLDGSVSVGGWAIDPDLAASIDVHVYVGSTGFATTANGARADVGGAYPLYGPNHGFSAVVGLGAAPGTTVCVYGINVASGANSVIGCRVLS